MTSATPTNRCVHCAKGVGQVTCGGCQQWFCMQHLFEHRQELSQEMDYLIQQHDLFQHDISSNNHDRHPLITRIDHWEEKSIERIRQVAREAREASQKPLDQTKMIAQQSLNAMMELLRKTCDTGNYNEIDLQKWTNQLQELREQIDRPAMIELVHDQDETSTNIPLIQLKLQRRRVPSSITPTTRWKQNGQTVAGGQLRGDALNQLNSPYGLDIDDDGVLLIADVSNNRVMRWKSNGMDGEIVAGGKGRGNRLDQLNAPFAVLIDGLNDSLLISDVGNSRVMRWPLQQRNDAGGEVLISNVLSGGLALDSEGSLYVAHYDKHEVRCYQAGDQKGVIVAGGNGQGAALNQLNRPGNLFVDVDRSVYVSDMENHRVMKWAKNAAEGIVVAGGQGQGQETNSAQLCCPTGILVDSLCSVYVVDQAQNRVMRWPAGAKKGEVLVDGSGPETEGNHLRKPTDISFDQDGNLYVVDRNNHRVQRFDIQLGD